MTSTITSAVGSYFMYDRLCGAHSAQKPSGGAVLHKVRPYSNEGLRMIICDNQNIFRYKKSVIICGQKTICG